MKWKAPVIYTAAGVLIGSTLMAATPAFAALNFKPFQANLVQNGQVVSKPSAISYNGTSYFGIWWLEQQLKKDGISVQWDGKSFTITGMPVQSTDTLSTQGSGSTGSSVFANTINVNGVTYVPLPEVQALLTNAGSQIQIKSGHEDQGDQQDSSLQGSIHQLQQISEKLTEYANGQVHGDGHGMGEVFSSFAGSLMQLQTVINNLSQLAQAPGSTSGSTSTTNSTTSSNSSSQTTSQAQLSAIVTSLQNDLTALSAYATQAVSGGSTNNSTSSTSPTTNNTSSTSTSGTTDLSSIVSDIQAQIQALSSLGQSSSGTSSQGQDH